MSALEGTKRATSLVKQFQTLSKGGSEPDSVFDIYDITKEVFSMMTFGHRPNQKDYWNTLKKLNGYQLRYVYLIDKKAKLTIPILPFSEIDKQGAGMYKGKKITLQERRVND